MENKQILPKVVGFCLRMTEPGLIIVTGPAGAGKTGFCQVIAGALSVTACARGMKDGVRWCFGDADAFGYRSEDGRWLTDVQLLAKCVSELNTLGLTPVFALVSENMDEVEKTMASLGIDTRCIIIDRKIEWYDAVYEARLENEQSGFLRKFLSQSRSWKRNRMRDFTRWHLNHWGKSMVLTAGDVRFPSTAGRSEYFGLQYALKDNIVVDFKCYQLSLGRIAQREYYGAVNIFSLKRHGYSGWRTGMQKGAERKLLLYSVSSMKVSKGWKTDPAFPIVRLNLEKIRSAHSLLRSYSKCGWRHPFLDR